MSKQEEIVCAAPANTFKKIVKCLQEGGSVYCFDVDMHVLGVLNTIMEKWIVLGHEEDKSICLQYSETQIENAEFNFYDKDGEEWER